MRGPDGGPRPNTTGPGDARPTPRSAEVQWLFDIRKGSIMRSILLILAVCVLGLLASSGPSSAEITYPWCAQYGGGRGGGRNCGFWTFEQCMAALWGNGGLCEANSMYRGPSPGMVPPPPGVIRRPG